MKEGPDRIGSTEKATKSITLVLGSVFIDMAILSGCRDKMQSIQAIDMLNIVAYARNLPSSSSLATSCLARVAVISSKDRNFIYACGSARLFMLSMASSL